MNLSYARNDIERLCGFKSKKLTMVNYVFTFIIGLLMSILFYSLLIPFYGKDITVIDMFFHGGTAHRSSLPYYTVFLTFWAVAILIVKLLKLKNQRKAFELDILPDDPNFVLSPRTAREILDRIYLQVDQPSCYALLDRIDLALSNLKNLGNVTGVSECLTGQASNDEDYLTNSYTILNGFIWAIPVLGFIGTVIGLSDAVGGFGKVVSKGADIEELKTALGGVTSGLSVAFETTLIALVLALIVQLFAKFVHNQEELFMDECADYCNRNIVAKMKNINLNTDENL